MKRCNSSLIISIIAIVLSVVTIILFFVEVSEESVVNLGTFIGVCVGCIGVFVTAMIGYQIFNSVGIAQRMSAFELQQLRSMKRIAELRSKVERHEAKAQSLNDLTNGLVAKCEDLQKELVVQQKKVELFFEDSKAGLYSGLIVKNMAESVLCQLRVIKLSFEIDFAEEQYGMYKIFNYIYSLDITCFGYTQTGYWDIDEFNANVSVLIESIEAILKFKKMKAEKLCVSYIQDAINIKIDSIKKGLSGAEGQKEVDLTNKVICEIEGKYTELFAQIEKQRIIQY